MKVIKKILYFSIAHINLLSLTHMHTHALWYTHSSSLPSSLFFCSLSMCRCFLCLSLSCFPPSLFLSLVVICLCAAAPPLSLRSGWARCWFNIIWRTTPRTFSPMGSLFLKFSLSLSHAIFLVLSGARTLSLFVTSLLLLSFLPFILTLLLCLAFACAHVLSFQPLQF